MVDDPPAFVLEPAPVRPRRGGERGRRALVALVIVAALLDLLVVGLVATGRVALPGPRPGPRVALVDPDGALAIVDPSGGGRVVHRASDTTFSFPAWSPDGTRVATVAHTPDGDAIEIFSGGSDGTIVYQSGSSAPFYVYWTPDGRSVTFLTAEGSSLALRSAPADASSPGTVLHQGAPLYWAWESDTRLLVHSGGNQGELFLGEVGSDGRTVDTVAGTPGDFRSPSVSADGRYRAYAVSHADGTAAIVVAAADGSSSHEVPVSGPAAVEFAPGGSLVAFIGPQPDDRQAGVPLGALRLFDAATGDQRELLGGEVVAFFWSPDGRTIAAISVPADGEGPSAEAPGGARLAAVRSGDVGGAGGTDATAVGVSLAFVDVASGSVRSRQRVGLSDLFVNQILPYFDQYSLSHRVWAPDSTSVLLPLVAEDGSESVQVIPADGTPRHVLAPGSMGFWSP